MFGYIVKRLFGVPLGYISLEDVQKAFHESRALINDDFIMHDTVKRDESLVTHCANRILSVQYAKEFIPDADCFAETVEVLLYSYPRTTVRSLVICYRDEKPALWKYMPSGGFHKVATDQSTCATNILLEARKFVERAIDA